IAQGGADPGVSPSVAIEEVGCAGVGLVKSGLNTFTGIERLVAGEAAGDRAVKEGARNGVLQARAHAQTLKTADVQNNISAAGARGMEINGQKEARDADFVVLKAVVASVGVGVHLQADLRVQFLLPSQLKIILRVSADIAHALVRIRSVVAD